jgi:hypothetical protein
VHERLAHTRAASSGDDADAADPGVVAADAEVAEPDELAVTGGDPRRIDVDVERGVHSRELLLVDPERGGGSPRRPR